MSTVTWYPSLRYEADPAPSWPGWGAQPEVGLLNESAKTASPGALSFAILWRRLPPAHGAGLMTSRQPRLPRQRWPQQARLAWPGARSAAVAGGGFRQGADRSRLVQLAAQTARRSNPAAPGEVGSLPHARLAPDGPVHVAQPPGGPPPRSPLLFGQAGLLLCLLAPAGLFGQEGLLLCLLVDHLAQWHGQKWPMTRTSRSASYSYRP